MTSPIKVALLTTTALGFAGSAYAADLYADYTPPSDVSYVSKSETPFTWSGVYFGGHVGGAWNSFNAIDDICSIYGPGEDKSGEFASICDLSSGTTTISNADSMFDGETVDYFVYDSDGVGAANNSLVFSHDHDDGDFDWIYGAQIGINQQYGNLVLGLEADITGFADGTGTTVDYFEHFTDNPPSDLNQTVTLTSESDIKWLATFRGRAGVAMGRQGRFLPYVTGGAAVAQVENMFSGVSADVDGGCAGDGCGFNTGGDDPEFQTFSTSETDYQFGFAVGAGGEYAFTDYISFGLEYLFIGFPNGGGTNSIGWANADDVAFTYTQENGIDNVQMVRAKLNFRFPPKR